MTEEELTEAVGLLARFHRLRAKHASHSALFALQLALLKLGVKPLNPVDAPDPHAPEGGSALALKAA